MVPPPPIPTKGDLDMTTPTQDSTWRREVLLHGCRWANNILVEILGNHAAFISVAGRNKLRDAIALLEEAFREFRGVQ